MRHSQVQYSHARPSIPFKNAVREAKIGEISHRAKRPDDYEGHVASVAFGLQVSQWGM